MGLDLTALQLEKALEQPGCPICRVKANSETRYINWLLWENINDSTTRGHIIASLGYCHEHVWLAGLLELEQFGTPTGNVTIYRHLVGIVQGRLKQYLHRIKVSHLSWWRRCLHNIFPLDLYKLMPKELQPRRGCRICETGQVSVASSLDCLLSGLSLPESGFRERYVSSDGICLSHLREALTVATRKEESGLEFLVENTLFRLSTLEHDLDEFNRKDTWDNRHLEKTEGEKNSWLHALTFFGGNQTSNNQ